MKLKFPNAVHEALFYLILIWSPLFFLTHLEFLTPESSLKELFPFALHNTAMFHAIPWAHHSAFLFSSVLCHQALEGQDKHPPYSQALPVFSA